MSSYLKYLEDNLNEKFANDFDEYRKYLKMYYAENARCPVDLKIPLEKKETDNDFIFMCKLKTGKDWIATVRKPVVMNLNLRIIELKEKYKNRALLFKDDLKENLLSPMYNPNSDKDLEGKLKELKNYEREMDLIEEIFNKRREDEDDIIKKRQDILKNLAEIRIKKGKLYKDLEMISEENKNSLIQVVKNEKEINEKRIKELSKILELKENQVKNWIIYFKFVLDYVLECSKLNDLNKNIKKIGENYDRVTSYFIISPPLINIMEESEKIKIKIKK